MRETASSMASGLTGRFSSALTMPERILASSKGTRLRSDFTTSGMTSSALSKVVKRSPQDRHSRRRRICAPPLARRESVTFVSSCRQKGQCMNYCASPQGGLLAVDRILPAQLCDLAAHLRDRVGSTFGIHNVRDPGRDLRHLRLAESAR